ncbi:hypothetical protein ncot_15535 [Nocardioides sp. JQ2195]|uniref:hypothetical protein n=1 Tax=Nocardioides sp. JQ2195 TaxID=2592334 RepID=UPI00143EC29A|nr:hypothetical protein [Nocardioides sp. JQ2195]QIX27843.1 hypothetical protein ncot_15535 [Nocardioides sp. JQ2195]
MKSTMKKTLTVLALTAVTSFGVVGPSSAATSAPVKGDRGGMVIFKVGDPWCC